MLAAAAALVAAAVGLWLGLPPRPAPPRVCAVAFSPDGRWLAAGDRQRGIAVWLAGSRQMVMR